MTGKRKFFMFLAQLVAAGVLVGLGKMTGDQLVSLETLAIPVFVAGNFGEHYAKKSVPETPKP